MLELKRELIYAVDQKEAREKFEYPIVRNVSLEWRRYKKPYSKLQFLPFANSMIVKYLNNEPNKGLIIFVDRPRYESLKRIGQPEGTGKYICFCAVEV